MNGRSGSRFAIQSSDMSVMMSVTVAFELLRRAHLDKVGIVVIALTRQHAPVIEARRIVMAAVAEMPFADDRRLVAGRLQQLRERDLPSVEVVAERLNAVDMIVRPGQDRRAARRADRIRAKAIVEAHAFVREPVQMRRLVDAAAVGADRMRRVVVGHDEQDVRSLMGCRWTSRCHLLPVEFEIISCRKC